MIAYAGIGSRKISEDDVAKISAVAKYLADRDVVLYSGNADGADITFQRNSDKKCVIYLPWLGFNQEKYDYCESFDYFVCGSTLEGLVSVDKYHPNPYALTIGGRSLMCRNHHQVFGFGQYPKVSIVVCCADRDAKGHETGGTGQACRIARDNGIPVLNTRYDYVKIFDVINNLLYSEV